VTVEIRPAHVGEAGQIATLHAEIWRDTYLDVAPPAALAKLDAAHRLGAWQKYLTHPVPRQRVLVAVNDAQIVGFAGFGPPTHPAFGTHGEVKHLYVDTMHKRQRIGQRLLRAAFRQMAADGFASAALAVVRSNKNALVFYAKMQGVKVGHFTDSGPIWKSENLIIAWDIAAQNVG